MTFALYLTRVFALSTAAALLAMGALAELLDLLDNGNTVIAHYGRLLDLAKYAVLITPTVAASVIPIASLIGALITFGALAGNNEIVAMRSSGMTLYWIVARLAPVALFIGVLYFALRFIVAPYTEIQVYELLREPETADAAASEGASGSMPAKGAYWISSGQVILAFDDAEDEGRKLRQVMIVERDADGRMVRHMTASEGRFEKGDWHFEGVSSQIIRRQGPVKGQDNEYTLVDGPQPIDILAATIPNARARLRQPGLPEAKIWAGSNSPAYRQVNFYEALAAPFVPMIMLLAAAPLALGTARHPSRVRDMAIALGTGFGYLLASGVSRSLGEAGVMPPLLAVLGPVVIFVLATISILAHREG